MPDRTLVGTADGDEYEFGSICPSCFGRQPVPEFPEGVHQIIRFLRASGDDYVVDAALSQPSHRGALLAVLTCG